jgi:uncharacterized repeat protein (TIGR04138 family)
MIDVIKRLAAQNPRYRKEGFYYVANAVETAHRKIEEKENQKRHITGKELIDEIIDRALEEFGYMARTVFAEWGITRTDDIGEIVFIMVENGVLSAREEDSLDDFKGVYDFETVFEKEYDSFSLD